VPDFKQFRLPDVGEGLVEAEIVSWKVQPGDTVAVNTVLVEIETAKSLVELPSPFAGVVGELLVDERVTVDVGTPIITVDVDPGGSPAAAPSGTDAATPSTAAAGAPPMPGPAAETVPDSPSEIGTPAPVPGKREVPPEPVEPGMIGEPAEGASPKTLVGYGPRTSSSKRRPRKGQRDRAGTPTELQEAFSTAQPVAQPVAPPRPPHAVTPVSQQRASGAALPEVGSIQSAALAPPSGSARALAKPPVRKLARDLGVDLGSVTATGPEGVVSRDDVLAASRAAEPVAAVAPSMAGERETRTPIKGVRKMTANAMVTSAFTAPHVTEFVTVDVSRTMRLVERLKDDRDFAGVKVSPLLLVAKALLLAVRRNAQINASWDNAAQEIVVKHYVNLGIAAATPRGLVVPNIKDAEAMPLRELAEALSSLTTKAREGRTQPAEMAGGTISITNVGVFGVDTGTPILNPGEAAILCFGAVRRMPWVHKGRIKPRWVTQLGLSFDHRLVDGDLGSRFLADVAAVLERPEQALVWA
jgi:2-oxoisovalerate dehydrogenase E2 component (dihydrolipoyl transacylase)